MNASKKLIAVLLAALSLSVPVLSFGVWVVQAPCPLTEPYTGDGCATGNVEMNWVYAELWLDGGNYSGNGSRLTKVYFKGGGSTYLDEYSSNYLNYISNPFAGNENNLSRITGEVDLLDGEGEVDVISS